MTMIYFIFYNCTYFIASAGASNGSCILILTRIGAHNYWHNPDIIVNPYVQGFQVHMQNRHSTYVTYAQKYIKNVSCSKFLF